MRHKVLTGFSILAVFLLVLSFSIALPIYVRPFYYAHITALDLPTVTGYSYDVIKRAYDEMINFCTLYTPFSTGDLRFSESGKSHFADVRVLFTLDFCIMILSAAYLVVLAVLKRKGLYKPVLIKGHGASFYGAIISVIIPVVVGALAAIDFDRAFEVFHAIFFPGKDNWLFSPSEDQIINVLPEEFFRNCAILIGVSVVFIAFVLIVRDCAEKSKRRRAAVRLAELQAQSDELENYVKTQSDDAAPQPAADRLLKGGQPEDKT